MASSYYVTNIIQQLWAYPSQPPFSCILGRNYVCFDSLTSCVQFRRLISCWSFSRFIFRYCYCSFQCKWIIVHLVFLHGIPVMYDKLICWIRLTDFAVFVGLFIPWCLNYMGDIATVTILPSDLVVMLFTSRLLYDYYIQYENLPWRTEYSLG